MVASALFPHMIVCTWIGGKGQVQDADFSALKGRHVTLWRDADDEGIACMDIAARKAAANVLLTVPIPKDWPEGCDVADVAAVGPGAGGSRPAGAQTVQVRHLAQGQARRLGQDRGRRLAPRPYPADPGPDGTGQDHLRLERHIALLHHPQFATLGWDLLQKKIVWNGQELSPGSSTSSTSTSTNSAAWRSTGVRERGRIGRRRTPVQPPRRPDPPDRLGQLQRAWTGSTPTSASAVATGPSAASKRWFLGHVARVLKPGRKQDLILILEGPQGRANPRPWRRSATPSAIEGYARLASSAAAG